MGGCRGILRAKLLAMEARAASMQRGLQRMQDASSTTDTLAQLQEEKAREMVGAVATCDQHLISTARQRREVEELGQLVKPPQLMPRHPPPQPQSLQLVSSDPCKLETFLLGWLV